MLRTHCGGHKCFPVFLRGQHLLRTQNLCPRHKNVSDFFQKHFASATNVSPFVRPRKNHEQQCVLHNVSSFATTLSCSFRFKVAHNSLVRIRHSRFRCSIAAIPIIFRKIFYSGTPPYGHLINTATSLLRPHFFVPAKWPYIFL